MKPAAFDHLCPVDLDQALAMLGASQGLGKACGGTQSLGPMLNLRLAQVDSLVDVSRIAALRGHTITGTGLSIGACVTHARIEDGELPDVTRGLLPTVAAGIAYRAVRNRGTLGGSLAHADPSADWVTTMTLLKAVMVIRGQRGERKVAADAFFAGPFTTALSEDELLVAIEVPGLSAGARWSYRKQCRKPGEFADAIAAGWIDAAQGIARVVIGALDVMPVAIDGLDRIEALGRSAALMQVLDSLGVDDPYQRDLHRTMLTRVLADLNQVATR